MKTLKIISTLLLLSMILAKTAKAQHPQESVYHPVTPNDINQPVYLQPVYDEIYDVNYTRISDANAFGYPEGSGQLRPGYAKTQAWNADMSKVFIGFTMILNAADYSIYKNIENSYPGGYFNDGRWSNVDPKKRYFCWHNVLLTINIETEVVDTVHVFENYNDIRIGPFEGNISADDRYVVMTNVQGTKATLYDILNNSELSSKDFGAIDQVFDWASITPSSDYIIVTNYSSGNTEVYDLNFNYLRNLTTGNNQHADFAVDAFGNEVLVQVIPLSMTRLSDGVATDLISDAHVCGNNHFNPSLAGHISGRNFNDAGWALCSTQIAECSNDQGYYYRTEMFSVKLDGSGTIRPFGTAYTSCTSYESYSKASISPDGTKVIFSSDWNLLGGNDSNVYAYVANVANSTSVELANREATSFSLFPNPSNGIFKIKGKSIDSVKVFDVLGRLLLETTEAVIDLSNRAKGYYLVQITSNNTVETHKIRIY